MERLDAARRDRRRRPSAAAPPGPACRVDEQRACELVAAWCEEDGLAVSLGRRRQPVSPAGRAPATAPPRSGPARTSTPCPAAAASTARWACWPRWRPLPPLGSRPLAAPLAVVVFRDEEGWRFGDGFFGSRARVRPGRRRRAGAARRRRRPRRARRWPRSGLRRPAGRPARCPAAYVEVHIEQGPVLERPAAAPRGRRLDRRDGRLHGDLPRRRRPRRHDADGGSPRRLRSPPPSSRCALRDARARRSRAPSSPSATCAIARAGRERRSPGRVRADGRRPRARRTRRWRRCWTPSRRPLPRGRGSPRAARVDRDRQLDEPGRCSCPSASAHAVRSPRRRPGSPIAELPSGAGHDAGVLAAAGVDAGMLFVRSLNGGVSHRPDELSDEADVAAAIGVLAGDAGDAPGCSASQPS